MEILCPNCQRKLTIQEQYAGQPMKCPLCAGTFNAPALPPTPGLPAAPLAPPVPPSPPPPAAPPPLAAVPPAPEIAAPPPPKADPPPAPTEHTGRFSVWISPRVCQFVPPVLLFLIFVLSFFTWIATAPGGVTIDSQNAWQAVFGSVSTDGDLQKKYSWVAVKDRDKTDLADRQEVSEGITVKAGEPGFGFLTFLWLLSFLLAFAVVVAVVALGYVHSFVPPKFQPYLRWRWAAAVAVTFVGFGFMLLQDSVGFNLERAASAAIDRECHKVEEASKKEGDSSTRNSMEDAKVLAIERGRLEQAVVRTFWYRCAFWFYFWALMFLFVIMLSDLRGPRPSPRIDLQF